MAHRSPARRILARMRSQPDPPPETRSGQSGRYALVSSLGEGGMAVVYRAFDRKLRVWRAVKVLLPRMAGRAQVRDRFEREARTMALLEHPNLARVYDVGQLGELPFMVMELVEGGTLDGWVEAHGAMPPRMAVQAVRQLLLGLTAVHELGVVHRDVKPTNVLVTPAGACKLTDFGVALTEGEDAGPMRMGTFGYMAPEQRTDPTAVDARADVYGVGATLWRLLRAAQPQDLFLADSKPILLRGIPDALHPALTRCLKHKKEHRFDTAQDVIDALDAAFDALPPIPEGTPPLAQPPGAQPAGTSVPSTFDTDGSASRPIPYFLPGAEPDPRRRAMFSEPFPNGAADGTVPAWVPPGTTLDPLLDPTLDALDRLDRARPTSQPPEVQGTPGPRRPRSHPSHPNSTPPPLNTPSPPRTIEPRSVPPGAERQLDRTPTGANRTPGAVPRSLPPPRPPLPPMRTLVLQRLVIPAIAAVIIAALVPVTMLFAVLMGAHNVNAAAADADRALTELVDVLQAQRHAAVALADRESDPQIPAGYDALDRASTTAERTEAAEHLVQIVQDQISRGMTAGARDMDAFEQSERLKVLRGARRGFDTAEHEWRNRASNVGGWVAVKVGLGAAPP